MLLVLRKLLVTAGLVGEILSRGGIGRPDAIALKNAKVQIAAPDDIGLIVELKSTHNLHAHDRCVCRSSIQCSI